MATRISSNELFTVLDSIDAEIKALASSDLKVVAAREVDYLRNLSKFGIRSPFMYIQGYNHLPVKNLMKNKIC